MTCFKNCNDHIDVFLKINPRKIGFGVNWVHPSTKESLIGEESVAMTSLSVPAQNWPCHSSFPGPFHLYISKWLRT